MVTIGAQRPQRDPQSVWGHRRRQPQRQQRIVRKYSRASLGGGYRRRQFTGNFVPGEN